MKTNRATRWMFLSLLVVTGCGSRYHFRLSHSGRPDAGERMSRVDAAAQVPDAPSAVEVSQGGAGGSADDDGGRALSDGPASGNDASHSGASDWQQQASGAAVQFRLIPGHAVPISISLPRAANVYIVVRDSSGRIVHSVALVDFADGTHSRSYSYCGTGDDCPHIAYDGNYAVLPPGTYTAQISVTDGSPLPVGCLSAPAAATRTITMRGNLDATSRPPETFDPTDARDTANFSTSLVVFDSLATPIQLDIYFCRTHDLTPTGEGDWTYHALTDGMILETEGDGMTPATQGRPTEVATGALRFDFQGRLISNTTSDSKSFTPKGATKPQPLSFNFGSGTTSGGTGLDGVTQYAASSAMSFVGQNGAAAQISCISTDGGIDADTDGPVKPSRPPGPSTRPDIVIGYVNDPDNRSAFGNGMASTTACLCTNVKPDADVDNPDAQDTSTAISVSLLGNLDYSAAPKTFDPTDPQGTSNFNTITTVNNSLGDSVPLYLYFFKNDADSTPPGDSGDWTYVAMTDSGYLTADATGAPIAAAGTLTTVAMGTLRFDHAGLLVSNTTTLNGFHPKGETNPQALHFNFGTGIAAGGTGRDGLTQYAAASAIDYWPNKCDVAINGFDMGYYRCALVHWPF